MEISAEMEFTGGVLSCLRRLTLHFTRMVLGLALQGLQRIGKVSLIIPLQGEPMGWKETNRLLGGGQKGAWSSNFVSIKNQRRSFLLIFRHFSSPSPVS